MDEGGEDGWGDSREKESLGVGGWKDEVDIEGETDGEGGDVSYPRTPRFTREKGVGVRGEDERKTLTEREGSESRR